MRRTKQINFYHIYKNQRTEQGPSRSGTWKIFLPPVLMALVLMGTAGFFYLDASRMQKKLTPIQEYLDAPETAASLGEAQEAKAALQKAITARDQLRASADVIAAYPAFTGAVVKQVQDALTSGVTLNAYSFQNSVELTLTAQANTPLEASAYVASLRQTGAFTAIDYFGYASQLDDLYHFEVILTLGEVQGK